MKILITICARGGSKGIPGKNIKLINGKPLINYSIEVAKRLADKHDAKITISSDDREILEMASNAGVQTEYKRPSELATDNAGKIDTIKDILLYEESLIEGQYDYILDLDVTSPLRTLEDLEISFDLLVKNDEAINIFSVNEAARNPYFNMVEEKENKFFYLVKTNPDGSIMTRQSAPKVFDLNASFYWYKREFFNLNLKSPITQKSLIFKMNHICFDLDHTIDFQFMTYLLETGQLDFQL